jgi:regulator of replication initiation timing
LETGQSKNAQKVLAVMPIQNKDEDYFIPVLAPYVQWVKAYQQLISALYKEHKTVKRAWKAFRDAIPRVETRLEFGIFEQILLFSLFLSEWNNSERAGGAVEDGGQSNRGGTHGVEYSGGQLDTVIQKLQSAFEDRDRALWNLKHLEQSTAILKDQKADLASQVTGLKKNVEALQIELDAANEHVRRVIQELDDYRVENARLREKSVVLKEKEASLEQQAGKLRKKLDKLSTGGRMVVVKSPETQQGFPQTVIQWVRQGTRQEVGQKVIQNPQRKLPPKKIGRWNAQLSKDGYYRLYRKIGGRVHSIYVGKELDIDKAERRIADRETKLFSPSPTAAGTESTYSKRQLKMHAHPRSIEAPKT